MPTRAITWISWKSRKIDDRGQGCPKFTRQTIISTHYRMKNKLLVLLPHLVAVVVFMAVAMAFFSGINDEYGLKQPDMDKVMGMSKELSDYRLMNEEEPLWSNNMFGGMPGYQTNMSYPSNWVRPVDRFLKLYSEPSIGSLYMCMFGFYILMLCLRVNPWLGIVGAVSFGLSTINILYLGGGHTSKVNAIGYMAPVLGGVILALRGRWLLGGAVFALFFALHLASNHLQMTYYLAFLVFAVVVGESIRLLLDKQWMDVLKAGAALLVGGALAIMPNFGSIYTTYEYSKLTTRGRSDLTIKPEGKEDNAQVSDGLNNSYILEYNMAPGEPWAMMIPNAKGGSSSIALTDNKEAMQRAPKNVRENMQGFTQYWGDQGSSAGAFYFGAGMMFLFVLALILGRDSLRWPFLVIAVMAILLCMKDMHALNRFFIEKFPMYNKFRDSKMMLVLIQVMAPALGILFIDGLLKNGLNQSRRKLLFGVMGGFLVVLFALIASPSITGPLISNNEVEYFDQMRDQYKSDARTVGMIGDIEDALVDVRSAVFTEDAQRTLLIVIAIAAVLVLISLNKVKWQVVAAVTGLIFLGDMWSVSSRYFNSEKKKDPRSGKMEFAHYERVDDRIFPYAPDTCDMRILRMESANIPDFQAKTAKLEDAMSSHVPFKGKDPKRIHVASEFGALQLSTNYRVLLATPGVFTDVTAAYFHKSIGGYHAAKLKRYQEMIDFYIADEIEEVNAAIKTGSPMVVDSVMASTGVLNMLNTKYVKYSPGAAPISNIHALGNAWFVNDLKMVATADEEMQALAQMNPATEVVVNKEYESLLSGAGSPDSAARATMTSYGTRRINYEVSTPVSAPLVFSEIYYPAGWVCRIDGQETPYFRANYFLRGVVVPAGEHKVEWSFEPKTYETGIKVNMAGSVSLLLLVLLVFGAEVWKWWRKGA